MISPFCKLRLITFTAVLAFSGVQPSIAADDIFPLPPELSRDVEFWLSVFTEYSTDEGLLHDNRNLAVVYERVAMPASVSRRERNRRVGDRRKHYQAILRKLGKGQRDNLSAEEERVLALWPRNVSNNELTEAAGRIRFQHGLSDRFREGLERSGRWREHVNASFTRLGVPTELAALPHVESSYNPAARSHVGASGIWQFTRGTGRRFMRIDHVLDERNDPYTATVAAGELLAYNYSILGNWPMAITAYNHGLSGARRAMQEFGAENYAQIMREYRGRTFGFASRNFYVAFLAALRVDQDPEKYFPGVQREPALNYDSAVLKAFLPADQLVSLTGISSRELASFNPATQATIWQGSKHLPKGFELRVPGGRLAEPLSELLANVGPTVWQQEQLPDLFHTVARGDTLSEIAEAYRTRVSTLVALNSLGSSNRIRIGQQIRLPAAGPAPVVVAAAPAPVVQPVPTPTPTPTPTPVPAPAPEPVADDLLVATAEDEQITNTGALPDQVDMGDDADAAAEQRTSLLSDPSDYTVAADKSIEVQPLETLGHYADWLEIRTQRLRDINRLAFRASVGLGTRLKLDFSKVDESTFEARRVAYQQSQQDAFFRDNTIRGVTEHTVKRGESVWVLALRQYKVPLWLFRQYNPQLDVHNVLPGTVVRLPILTRKEA